MNNLYMDLGILGTIFLLGALGKYKIPFNNFLLITQFITRLPLKISLSCEMEDFKKGTLYFPMVGALIGGIQYLVFIITKAYFPMIIAATFTVLSMVFITGGLHIDGLSDTCDGFFSFKGGKDKIIEIMKDSRVGAFGVIAIIFDITLRILGVYYMGVKGIDYGIIVVPSITRAFTVLLFLIGKPAKEKGSGNLYIGNTTPIKFVGALISAFLIGKILIGYYGALILILSGLIITLLFSRFCSITIQGHTGDTLGANNELVEIGLFLIISSSLF
ncbi:adenosylcobinamide-GDP ribazoletransferase [Clostridium hydrogeniformans]|uniref:adenosylcobinamide-GDP ribazoletransferase n=1 Tax=Clostridium hydrogeniformans TaxID=349933 RepID=UPI000A003022|nr:adenosylcobinamide-GDP ribazoletransferase [Clostridium hydrogeniformans]